MNKKPWEKQELYDTTHPITRHAYNPNAVRTVESIDEYALPILPYLVEVGTIPAKGEPEDRLRQLFHMDSEAVKDRLMACEKELMEQFDGKLSSLKEITLGSNNFDHSFHVQFTTDEPLTEQDYDTIHTVLTNTKTLDFLNEPNIGFSRHETCGPVLIKAYTWKHFGWQNIIEPWAIRLDGNDEKDRFREAEIEMNGDRLRYRIDIPKDGLTFPGFAKWDADDSVIPNKFREALADYKVERLSAMSYGSDCSAKVQDLAMIQFRIPYENQVIDPHELAAKLYEVKNELKQNYPELMQESAPLLDKDAFSKAIAALDETSNQTAKM